MFFVIQLNLKYPDEQQVSDIFWTKPSRSDIEAYFNRTRADLMNLYHKCELKVYKIDNFQKVTEVSNVVLVDEGDSVDGVSHGDGYLLEDYSLALFEQNCEEQQ